MMLNKNEKREEILRVCKLIRNRAFEVIKKNFENRNRPQNYLEFHSRRHSQSMVRRLSVLINMVNGICPKSVSWKDKNLAFLAASCHDIIQNWKAVTNKLKDGRIERVRSKQNEKLSYLYALDQMNNFKIFSTDDKSLVKQMIYGTRTKLDSKKKTLFQPEIINNLNNLPLVVILFALADLDRVMDGPAIYKKENRQIFIEDNLDIKLDLKDLRNIKGVKKQDIINRLIQWPKRQADFVKGRKYYLKKEIGSLPLKMRKYLLTYFLMKSDEIIDSETKSYQDYLLAKVNLIDILKDFGYKICIRKARIVLIESIKNEKISTIGRKSV